MASCSLGRQHVVFKPPAKWRPQLSMRQPDQLLAASLWLTSPTSDTFRFSRSCLRFLCAGRPFLLSLATSSSSQVKWTRYLNYRC